MVAVKKYQGNLVEAEKDIGVQFLPLAVCPLPPRPPKKPLGEDWVKTVGKTTIRIVASSHHGIPYGRDILIVLYLIQEAIRQDNRVIRFESMRHYLETFKLDDGAKHYREAVERFKRVFYSSWFWEDRRTDDQDGAHSLRFHIIDAWNVFFDPANQASNPLFESFIELSPRFWEILQAHPIPYKLDAVIQFKDKPAVLNLYLYLVYRTWQNWHGKKGKEFIPFFGDAGLQKQLSSDIAEHKNFRTKIRGWLEGIKVAWPECPVSFERETNPAFMGRNKLKRFKDGLFIEVKSVDQLHVAPHWPKELRLAQEQAAALDPVKHPCPSCQSPLQPRSGAVRDGKKFPDYYRCVKCKKNFRSTEIEK